MGEAGRVERWDLRCFQRALLRLGNVYEPGHNMYERPEKTQISLPIHAIWSDSSLSVWTSWKHAYIMLTPINPTLYCKTGVYRGITFFLFLLKNIDCGYSSTHNLCFNIKSEFLSENFHILVVKFSVSLNRHVFVMRCFGSLPIYRVYRTDSDQLRWCTGWSESSLGAQVSL